MTSPGEEEIGQFDLTPDPHILEVLGEIPYQPWQCLAELTDNSYDDLNAGPRDSAEPAAVHITIPKASATREDALVAVHDNGRGMSQETLEKSLRAGYTGKTRLGTLGLFGMGFNIATARLGNRTEVRTTQAGEEHWVVTEINFKEMRQRGHYHVPFRYAVKEGESTARRSPSVTSTRRCSRYSNARPPRAQ
jgi:hypothetical protein